MAKSKELKKVLIIPDQHFPYNNKTYWELLLKVGKKFKPDSIVIMGDFIDAYAISAHTKDPTRTYDLAGEIDETRIALQQLIKLGAKENIYIAGNHEFRIERHFMENDPEMYKVLTREGKEPTDELIGISKLGFTYYKYRDHCKVGKMYFTHDVGTAGKWAHYKAGDVYHRNITIGHTHTMGFAVQGDADGDKHVNAMFGWGGDDKYIDYMHRASVTKNWSLGFGIMYVNEENDNVYVQPVPVVNYQCVVEGKLFDVID